MNFIPKNRLEAFSDGVIAILITIMVLELKVPRGESLEALTPLLPVFLSYVLSFVYLGIYWNNHHHMLQACHKVTGAMLWANLHLLFWLSLVPFGNGMDGRKPLRLGAFRAVWRDSAHGRDRILYIAEADHRIAGTGLSPEESHRERLEGEALAHSLRGCYYHGVLGRMDYPRSVRPCCIVLACARSTD